MELLFVIAMAMLGRAAGGGLGAHLLPWWLNRLPEALLAVPFGLTVYFAANKVLPWELMPWLEAWHLGLATWAWVFAFIETGHFNGYHMGFVQRPDRWQSLDYIVRPLLHALKYCAIFFSKLFYFSARVVLKVAEVLTRINAFFNSVDITPRGKLYCWVFMGIKGGLIALPMLAVTPNALAFIVGFPVAYHVAMKETGGTAPAEYLAWAFGGTLILIANMAL